MCVLELCLNMWDVESEPGSILVPSFELLDKLFNFSEPSILNLQNNAHYI